MSSPKKNPTKAKERKEKSRKKDAPAYVAWDKKSIGNVLRKVILVVFVIVGLFLVLMPVLPQVPYYIRQLRGEQIYKRQGGNTSNVPGVGEGEPEGFKIPDENWLVIPAVGIDVPVVEGSTDEALERGAWRRPGTSTPDRGGNTVITGHRFKYLPPSNLTFYHLDKVEVGDDIIVYWDEVEYEYVVTKVFVVEPSQIEIEGQTSFPQLTLYTCTPLWTAKQRLVVLAEPVDDGAQETEVVLEEMGGDNL